MTLSLGCTLHGQLLPGRMNCNGPFKADMGPVELSSWGLSNGSLQRDPGKFSAVPGLLAAAVSASCSRLARSLGQGGTCLNTVLGLNQQEELRHKFGEASGGGHFSKNAAGSFWGDVSTVECKAAQGSVCHNRMLVVYIF